jgi:hypothetical protein
MDAIRYPILRRRVPYRGWAGLGREERHTDIPLSRYMVGMDPLARPLAYGRVHAPGVSNSRTRLPSPRGATLQQSRHAERVWVEGGRSQMATVWTEGADGSMAALNSGRAGMDYVQGLSRLRPDSKPMHPLTREAAQREIDSVWRSSTFGKIRGGSQPYLSDSTQDWRVRPAGFVPRTNRVVSPRRGTTPRTTQRPSTVPSSFTGPGLPGTPHGRECATPGSRPRTSVMGESFMSPRIMRFGSGHGVGAATQEMDEAAAMAQPASSHPTSLLSWGVEEVCVWLRTVAELPQYEATFRKNYIDGHGLLSLSTDLRGRDNLHKLLGVVDRVHRGHLLAHIRKLEVAQSRKRELQAGQQIGTVNAGNHRHSWKPSMSTRDVTQAIASVL